eukprot:Gb_07650 [translate_table: standard]
MSVPNSESNSSWLQLIDAVVLDVVRIVIACKDFNYVTRWEEAWDLNYPFQLVENADECMVLDNRKTFYDICFIRNLKRWSRIFYELKRLKAYDVIADQEV